MVLNHWAMGRLWQDFDVLQPLWIIPRKPNWVLWALVYARLARNTTGWRAMMLVPWPGRLSSEQQMRKRQDVANSSNYCGDMENLLSPAEDSAFSNGSMPTDALPMSNLTTALLCPPAILDYPRLIPADAFPRPGTSKVTATLQNKNLQISFLFSNLGTQMQADSS